MATYTTSKNADPTKAAYGESSAGVSAYQTQLNNTNKGVVGYTPLVVDGKYGPLTQAASQFKAPAANSLTVKSYKDNPDGTTTNYLSDGSSDTGNYSKNPDGSLNFNPSSTNPKPRPVLYTDPNEPDLLKASSVDEIQKQKLASAQGMLGSLNSYYDKLVNESKITGENNLRKTNAVSALTGLSGSTEANFQSELTEKATQKDINLINAEREAKITEVLYNIQSSSVEEARQSRVEARQSEQDRLAYREKTQKKAVDNLTILSKTASGANLEGLKATLGEEEYNRLITNAGGEAMASAILFENRPKDTVMGNPTVVGGKMVQAYQTPDGKVKYETVDLPAGVVPDQIQSVEKTDAGIFIIKKDGTYSRITGSGKAGTGTGTGGGAAGITQFPQAVQDAAQAIYSGKSKLTEFPSKDRLAINSAAQILYSAEGGNELAQGAYDAITNLENNPGFEHAIGTNIFFGYGKNASGSDSASFIADLDKLKANIKLVNVKYLKGAGALSDQEGATLENAGTSLSTRISEKSFKEELARVKAALLKANNIRTSEDKNITPDGQALQTNGGIPTQFTATTPDGQTFSFPTQAALDQFKKAAGIQ